MVATKFPFGAINESCIRRISAFNNEFTLTDDCGNVWDIDELTFEELKHKGYEVTDFRRRKK